jgi:hypothetical protein
VRPALPLAQADDWTAAYLYRNLQDARPRIRCACNDVLADLFDGIEWLRNPGRATRTGAIAASWSSKGFDAVAAP